MRQFRVMIGTVAEGNQLCDLPPSIQFYVLFWGQTPKTNPNNSLFFNELNEKASPAFEPNRQPIHPKTSFLCRKFSISLNASCNECEYCIPSN